MKLRTLSTPFALAATLALAAPVAAQEQIPQIRVTSTATVTAPPDEASVTIGVVSEGLTAQEAMRANTEKMQQVMTGLEAAGIPSGDIATLSISLDPRYANERPESGEVPRIAGYQATNIVRIRVDEIDGLGSALDAVVEAGVNTINSIEFSIEDTSELEAEARAKAAAALREKAEQYAEAIGTRVVGVISIDEQMVGRPMPMKTQRMEMAADMAVPVSAGDVEVEVTISGAFEIDDELSSGRRLQK